MWDGSVGSAYCSRLQSPRRHPRLHLVRLHRRCPHTTSAEPEVDPSAFIDSDEDSEEDDESEEDE